MAAGPRRFAAADGRNLPHLRLQTSLSWLDDGGEEGRQGALAAVLADHRVVGVEELQLHGGDEVLDVLGRQGGAPSGRRGDAFDEGEVPEEELLRRGLGSLCGPPRAACLGLDSGHRQPPPASARAGALYTSYPRSELA